MGNISSDNNVIFLQEIHKDNNGITILTRNVIGIFEIALYLTLNYLTISLISLRNIFSWRI